eukprot:TRINITY_DN19510_c0_g1_i1.p1 TRINITY_DN19510_c0_g1~~TRINITY_DN19510_c0_g1_i1.p1  ORF type:complete len:437 (+),score=40.76 TRINITY_DN19510_c0_g1_i1:88-1311(+)
MQAGFAMKEAGSVQHKNSVGILSKNVLNGFVSVICYWILGYGFAMGNTKGGFIGVNLFGLASDHFDVGDASATNPLEFQYFFIQWAYAAVAVTIIGGALAERCKLQTYLIVAFFVSIWIFPIIVHWCWGQGWLSPFANQRYDYLFYGKESNNFIDMAGSGVVHTVGGVAALVGAIALGARKGRFEGKTFQKNSAPLAVLGSLILWIAYYGFNLGSTYGVVGSRGMLAGKIAAITTLSAAFSGMTMLLLQTATNSFDVVELGNAVIAGLVAISAGCGVVEMWGAMLTGIGACLFFFGASKVVESMKIDDAVNAFAVHGAAGIWGVLAVGIFGSDDLAAFAGYYGSAMGNHPFRTGEQFGVQLVGILCIVAWTFGWSALLFFGLKSTVGIRVEDAQEEKGDDECALCQA